MKVKLISYTVPAEEYLDKGLEDVQDLIAYCARVSNPANQYNTETSERLIRYLIKHGHWSPLEMASACIEIETTRDIAHQIVRHRSFSFQEFSQRYANPQDQENTFDVRECRFQDPKNRQNSIPFPEKKDYWDVNAIHAQWLEKQKEVIYKTKEVYDWAIDVGIAKEQARAVLPEGLTKTTLMMNGTIRSWVHYVDLRSENGTQKEHMDIAKECGKIITNIFPLMYNFDRSITG
tara:strand:+ start:86 stop:787 length:702 start_codon:yes stop_codon:yes gene_type:complete